MHGFGDDARAGDVGPARVQDEDRDVLLDGRHNGGRVQHLGSEVGQFRGFGERDGLDAVAAGENGGVGGEHAVHVGPDLDLFGADARAHDGGGEIGAAAAQRGGDAIFGGADEAAHDDHAVLRQGRDHGGEAGVGFGEIGRGLRVALVGDDDLAGVHVLGRHAEIAEGEGHDVAGKALPVAGNCVHGARCEFPEHGQPFDEFGELLEVLVESPVQIGAHFERGNQAGFAGMEVAKVVELADVFLAVARDGGGCDGEQLIGGLAHGRHHNDGATALARLHDSGDALDGGGRLH